MLTFFNGDLKMETLQEILDSEQYQVHQSETLLNPQYHMINNTGIDVDIMIEHNEYGMFGVSHGDFIDCWIDYLDILDLDEKIHNSIMKEIIAVQTYHTEQSTIDDLV